MEDTNLAAPESAVAQADGAPAEAAEPEAPEPEAAPPSPAPEPSLLDRLKVLGDSMPFLARVLAGDPTLTVEGKTYRFQMSFIAQAALLKELGLEAETIEEAGKRLDARFGNNADPAGQMDAILAALRAALLRHHGEISQDELSDILASLTTEEVGSLLGCLGAYFQGNDGLGDYFAGRDPLIRLPNDYLGASFISKAYVLRWTMAEAQEVLKDIDVTNLERQFNWRDCRRILVRALKRYQPTGVSPEELDDLGWRLGLAGIQRLIAGPQRKDRPTDPNAPPGPAPAGPGDGTSTPS